MVERILIFLVLGFFVFIPETQSFWSEDPISWYIGHLVWLALIALCYFAQPKAPRTPPEQG